MPQPPGTFLRQQTRDKVQFEAGHGRRTVALASARTQEQQLARLHAMLERVDERELDERRRELAALADRINKGEATNPEDEIRQKFSECVGKAREILEKMGENAAQLYQLLRVPTPTPVVRTQVARGGVDGVDLALVIMLLRLFEILVRKRRSSHR